MCVARAPALALAPLRRPPGRRSARRARAAPSARAHHRRPQLGGSPLVHGRVQAPAGRASSRRGRRQTKRRPRSSAARRATRRRKREDADGGGSSRESRDRKGRRRKKRAAAKKRGRLGSRRFRRAAAAALPPRRHQGVLARGVPFRASVLHGQRVLQPEHALVGGQEVPRAQPRGQGFPPGERRQGIALQARPALPRGHLRDGEGRLRLSQAAVRRAGGSVRVRGSARDGVAQTHTRRLETKKKFV
mmetsp:Transcript_6026/g.25597  ORF Transcript_6026/g.25597 Transcript_6026/m.25597 type:complete len:247 (-) Transcript_6026:27-767(-)